MANTKSNGYENLLMLIFAAGVIVTLFVTVFHQLDISVMPNIRNLFETLKSN